MPAIEIVKCIAALILCGVLVRLVMRGRWIVWAHPVCSNCSFNLQGLPETSGRCPECGEELWKVRRNSIWKRRWISLGLSLVIVLATVWVISIVAPFRHLNAVLPTRVLLRELEIPSLRPYVWNEVWFRAASGELSPGEMSALADAAIKDHSSGGFSGVLQGLQQRGLLPASKLPAAAAAAVDPSVSIRHVVARGDPLVIGAVCPIWFTGIRVAFSTKVFVDGTELALSPNFAQLQGSNYAWANHTVDLPPAFLANLKDGPHSVIVNLDIQLSEAASGKLVATRKYQNASTFTLLAAGKPSVNAIPPEHLPNAKRLRDMLSLTEVNANGLSPMFRQFDTVEQASGGLVRDGIDLVYQVLARSDGKIQPLGTMIISSQTRRWTPAATQPTNLGDHADIIFRPDPAAAARTLDIGHISGDEFTIPNVPVKPAPHPIAEKK